MTTTATTFQSFLNARQPEDGQILIALRYYMSEVTDDKLPEEMLDDIASQVDDRAALVRAREEFAKDQASQVAAALLFFSTAWDDPAERARIERAFDAVSTKLPVVEMAILAIVGMYALFLTRTGGVKTVTKTTRRKKDGSSETTFAQENFSPTEPIMGVISVLTGRKRKEGA